MSTEHDHIPVGADASLEPARLPDLVKFPWGQAHLARIRSLLLRAGLPAAALLLLFFADEPVVNWVQPRYNPSLEDFLGHIFYLGSAGTPLIIGAPLFALGLFLNRPRLVRTARLLVLSALVAGVIVLVAKPLIERKETFLHPLPTADAPWHERYWGYFPSGHAAVSFAMAGALAAEVPALAPVVYILATLVSVEVVHDGSHAPSDVFAGAWLGLLVSRWLARRARRRRKSRRAREGSRARASSGALALAAISALAFPVLLLHFGSWGFFDPDEGRYAEIPFEMIARGDFVTPTLNYVPYFEKPPLFFWLVAGAYRLFGTNEWAGRLVPILCALLSLWLAFLVGRRMFGARAGLYASLILATTLMWVAMGHLLIVDVLLSTLIFLALTLWWFGHTEREGRTLRWDAAFWVAVALGVLAKGPVAAVLVLGSVGLYTLLCRQGQALVRPSWLACAALAPLVAAPWFVLVAGRNPGFNNFFWYEQHVGRYLGLAGNREHDHGLFYFAGLLPLVLFPWSVFVPGAVLSGWRRLWPVRSEKQRAVVFLTGSAVLITLFFSISVSKLPQYVLPVIPLVAVALGAWFEWAGRHARVGWGRSLWRSPLRGGALLCGVVLVLGSVASFALAPRLLDDLEAMGPGRAVVTGLVLLFWGVALLIAARRRNLRRLMGAVAGGVVALVVWLKMLTMALAPNHYCKPLLDYVRPGLDSGATLLTSGGYLPTVGFYTGRRLFVNGSPGEIAFGKRQISETQRQAWFSQGVEDLRARMSGPAPVYLLVRDHDTAAELLPQLGDGIEEIIWNKRRSILGNAAAAKMTPPLSGGVLGSRRSRSHKEEEP